jgi:hypothetical protein
MDWDLAVLIGLNGLAWIIVGIAQVRAWMI